MTKNRRFWQGCVGVTVCLTAAAIGFAQQDGPTGTVQQPLVGGSVVDTARQEDFGLVSLGNNGGGDFCSGSIIRNNWVITAAHCVETGGGTNTQTPDPTRPGQFILNPIGNLQVTAKWKTTQIKNAVRVETFRPYDVAIVQLNTPLTYHGQTSGYSRLIFQDGQFPYYGEVGGAQLLGFGRGVYAYAKGSGATATSSLRDNQFRIGYFRVNTNRQDNTQYSFPTNLGWAIAGGDSGGPSFASVLNGYALVGVHSNSLAEYMPGKAREWNWVTKINESRDAPVTPVWGAISRIIGPLTPTPPEYTPNSNNFIGTFAATPPGYMPIWLYGIQPNGERMWYRKDSNATAWQGPKRVGNGWNTFRDVVAAGGNSFYALRNDGKIIWYQHDGYNDGSPAWKGPKEVGTVGNYKRIFSGGDGILYALRADGMLVWMRQEGYQTGFGGFTAPVDLFNFHNFAPDAVNLFSNGAGSLYWVRPDGTLWEITQSQYLTGKRGFGDPRKIGDGWNNFRQIIPSGEGVLLAVTQDGRMLWYKHTMTRKIKQILAPSGVNRGSVAYIEDTWQGPIALGAGWQGYGKIVAVIPGTTPPVIH